MYCNGSVFIGMQTSEDYFWFMHDSMEDFHGNTLTVKMFQQEMTIHIWFLF